VETFPIVGFLSMRWKSTTYLFAPGLLSLSDMAAVLLSELL